MENEDISLKQLVRSGDIEYYRNLNIEMFNQHFDSLGQKDFILDYYFNNLYKINDFKLIILIIKKKLIIKYSFYISIFLFLNKINNKLFVFIKGLKTLNKNVINYKFENTDNFKLLYNSLYKSNSTSSLVCGFRGVGKTTLVESVINKLKDDIKCEDVIDIKINAGDIDLSKDKEINKNVLLRKFIRKFYFSVVNEGNNIGIFNKKILEELFYNTLYDKIELNGKLKISNNLNILKKIIYFSKSFFVILFSILSGFILDYVINKILGRNIIIDGNLLLSIYNNLSYFQVIWILFLAYISYYLFSTILNIKFNSVLYKNINDNEISEYRIYNFLNGINKLGFFSKLNFYFSNIKKYFSSAIEKDYWKFKNFSVLKKKKLVIVFDEMDKFYDKISINNNDETDKVELLFNIIGTLKYMFFNKGTDIHFIFIFGKEIYDYFRINLNTDDDLFTNIFSNIIYHGISKNEEVIFKNPLEDLNKKVNIDLNSYLYINHLCNLRHLNNKIENYYNIKEIINYKIPKKEDIEYVYNIFYNFIYLIIEYYLDKNFTYNSLIFYKRYIESNSGMFKNTFLNNVIKVSDNKINSIEILLKKDLSYRDYMINKLLKVKNYIIDQKGGYVDINETLQYFENWDKGLDNLYKEWYEDFKILLNIYIINIYIENSKSSNRKDLKIDNKNLYINLK